MSAVHSAGQDVRSNRPGIASLAALFIAEMRPFDGRLISSCRHLWVPPAQRSHSPAQRSHAPLRGRPSAAQSRSEPARRRRELCTVDPVAYNGDAARLHDNIWPTSVACARSYASVATHRDRSACGSVGLQPDSVAAHEHDVTAVRYDVEIPLPHRLPLRDHRLAIGRERDS
jgi:hypothetical protein